jgi:hypothetical protein
MVICLSIILGLSNEGLDPKGLTFFFLFNGLIGVFTSLLLDVSVDAI